MTKEFEGKKLMILGGNPETVPLVEMANGMGIKTIVASARHTDPAKAVAWKAYDIIGMDSAKWVSIAREEGVDGVLVGVADILVPLYCRICDALNLPCYATEEIVRVFSYKDEFKTTCEKYGIHGIPEFYLDSDLRQEDIDKISFPVMVKPVDNGGGVGMTVCYNASELPAAVEKALAASNKKRFIVEKYMQCDDVGIYYTFKDGYCSLSCIFDRYTTDEQPGFSRVSLGGIYPSRHIDDYYAKMHANAVRLFDAIGIRNGVLLLQAFYEDGTFYVYDTGFRFQGEAPHLLMKAIHGFDQREMLIRYALTGSEGDVDLRSQDDARLGGKSAATVWFLLREGTIARIEGLDEATGDPCVIDNVQRMFEGSKVEKEWVGTEKQVLTRLYVVCESKEQLKEKILYLRNTIKVFDEDGNNMLLAGFNVNKALEDGHNNE